MRERKSARLLVISPSSEVLLFRFNHTEGALAGDNYWATPGGGLEGDESFEAAAIRELWEETGIVVQCVGAPVGERAFALMLPSGEEVFSIEQYFVVHAPDHTLSRSGWTAHEMQVMAEHHWWSEEALRTTQETVWPQELQQMLRKAGVFDVDSQPSVRIIA